MAHSPSLAESFYDEAVTGEMALHILKGEYPLFFWGQPYMGSLEAFLASFLFHLFWPSAFFLHFTDVFICAFMILIINRLGHLVGGWAVGLLVAAYWSFSPLYLSVVGLLATGGHEEACILGGAFVLFALCWLAFRSPKNLLSLSLLIGVIAGISCWSSLLAVPSLIAGAVCLVIARPKLLLTRVPWIGIGGLLIGSLPFWVWQYYHNFSTFGFFKGDAGGGLKYLPSHLYVVLRFSLIQSMLGAWWDGHSVLGSFPPLLAWGVFIIFYLPVFILSLWVIVKWLQRLFRRQNPFQEPVDFVVATFWVLILSFSASERGADGSLRYSLVLYGPFTILLAIWLHKIFQFRKVLGSVLLVGLFGFNLFIHYLYLEQCKTLPYRPIDGLIMALHDRGIHYAYADNRISQVLTFESREKIICADYSGQRNYNYLQAVDKAPVKEVAIITDKRLGNPYPKVMADSLRLLGGSARRVDVGPFVFWYHFEEPAWNLKPLSPQGWRITSSLGSYQGDWIKDRDILTGNGIPNQPGNWLAVDLGRPVRVGRISILPGCVIQGGPSGIKIEYSLDGKIWQTLYQIKGDNLLPGLHWFNGRPKLELFSRLQISFSPCQAQYLRITDLSSSTNPEEVWPIAELFVYEVIDQPAEIGASAQGAYSQAVQALNHFMDDPTGPHHLFPGTSKETRIKQVDWGKVIKFCQETIHWAPDWEEPYQLFAEATVLGDLVNTEVKTRDLIIGNYSHLFLNRGSVSIPTQGWKITSNVNEQEVNLATDGVPETRWTTEKKQAPGQFFQLDLRGLHTINGLTLFLGRSINDYPRILKILVSKEGAAWKTIPSKLSSEYALYKNHFLKNNYYFFKPVQARFVKLMQMGQDPFYWWSIHEIAVFGGNG